MDFVGGWFGQAGLDVAAGVVMRGDVGLWGGGTWSDENCY